MSGMLPSTAIGVFTDRKEAESAVADLQRAGFRDEQIGVAVRGPEAVLLDEPAGYETKAPEGGVTGAVAGGALGGIAGAVAAGLIPGVGPILGLGLLAAIGGGAAAGAVTGGLVGTLIGLGIPEHEAHSYQAELEGGRTLVTVKADGRYNEAVQILRAHGALGKGKPLV
jgi:hypothetical protein